MAYGFKMGGTSSFKSVLKVTTNPNATVVATLERDPSTFYRKNAGASGIVEFPINKKGVYVISVEDIDITNTTLSTSPVSVSNALVEKNQETVSVNHVYINNVSPVEVGGYSTGSAYIFWNKPPKLYNGVRINRNTIGPNYDISVGDVIHNADGQNYAYSVNVEKFGVVNSGLGTNITYHYTVWPFINHPNGVTYYGLPTVNSYLAVLYTGASALKATGDTFTVPQGVRSLNVCCVGGGGGGGQGGVGKSSGSNGAFGRRGGGGGGGGYVKKATVPVTPGQIFYAEIGGGGAGVASTGSGPSTVSSGTNGGAGNATRLRLNNYVGDVIVQAAGGNGGTRGSGTQTPGMGGNGGSGGGMGGFLYQPSAYYYAQSKRGGSDGYDGGVDVSHMAVAVVIGYGQRSVAGANGENGDTTFNGVTYSYGGGGAGYQRDPDWPREYYDGYAVGTGGAGGHGSSSNYGIGYGTNGIANSGSGGGGGYANYASGAGGSGIIVITY